VTQLGETLIGTIIKYKSKASLTYLSLHIPSISCSSSKEEKKKNNLMKDPLRLEYLLLQNVRESSQHAWKVAFGHMHKHPSYGFYTSPSFNIIAIVADQDYSRNKLCYDYNPNQPQVQWSKKLEWIKITVSMFRLFAHITIHNLSF
jgi:hypothetical protein